MAFALLYVFTTLLLHTVVQYYSTNVRVAVEVNGIRFTLIKVNGIRFTLIRFAL